jgi:C4-dicarboxylate-specific signal transduction histidine kinase
MIQIFFKILILVFFTELATMFIISKFEIENESLEAVIDSAILSLIVFYPLYLLILQYNKSLRQELNEELEKNRQKDQMLIQSSKLAIMGEMIAMIAHQWKQPLAAQRGFIGAIKFKNKLNKLDNSTLNENLEHIDRLALHMSNTIDDFSNFFKPNKEKNLICLEKALQECIKLISATFEKKGISIHILVNIDLQREVQLEIFDREFKQVVINILNNAKDAIVENGINKGEIIITISEDNKNIVVSINDNGGGIPDNVMPKLFDPYFSTKSKNGTGLGLYMSKIIIDDHLNGELSASNENSGASFHIKLPKA